VVARSAQLLLQGRTRVLNDDIFADFARWFPGFAALGLERLAGRRTGPGAFAQSYASLG
jgi:hypothetical protein